MIFWMGGPQLGEFEAGLLAALISVQLSVVVEGYRNNRFCWDDGASHSCFKKVPGNSLESIVVLKTLPKQLRISVL